MMRAHAAGGSYTQWGTGTRSGGRVRAESDSYAQNRTDKGRNWLVSVRMCVELSKTA